MVAALVCRTGQAASQEQAGKAAQRVPRWAGMRPGPRVPREGGYSPGRGRALGGDRVSEVYPMHIRPPATVGSPLLALPPLSLSHSFSIPPPLFPAIATVALSLGWRGILFTRPAAAAVGGPRVVAQDSACRGGMLSSQPGRETARLGAQHAAAGCRRLAGRGTSPAAAGRRRGLTARQAGPARAGAPAQRVAGVQSCLGSSGLAALPVIASIHSEPGNALSLPTWAIHVSSVVEWVTAPGPVLAVCRDHR